MAGNQWGEKNVSVSYYFDCPYCVGLFSRTVQCGLCGRKLPTGCTSTTSMCFYSLLRLITMLFYMFLHLWTWMGIKLFRHINTTRAKILYIYIYKWYVMNVCLWKLNYTEILETHLICRTGTLPCFSRRFRTMGGLRCWSFFSCTFSLLLFFENSNL